MAHYMRFMARRQELMENHLHQLVGILRRAHGDETRTWADWLVTREPRGGGGEPDYDADDAARDAESEEASSTEEDAEGEEEGEE
jgi:hypothetical protein